jgi:hypothetical protein
LECCCSGTLSLFSCCEWKGDFAPLLPSAMRKGSDSCSSVIVSAVDVHQRQSSLERSCPQLSKTEDWSARDWDSAELKHHDAAQVPLAPRLHRSMTCRGCHLTNSTPIPKRSDVGG